MVLDAVNDVLVLEVDRELIVHPSTDGWPAHRTGAPAGATPPSFHLRHAHSAAGKLFLQRHWLSRHLQAIAERLPRIRVGSMRHIAEADGGDNRHGEKHGVHYFDPRWLLRTCRPNSEFRVSLADHTINA